MQNLCDAQLAAIIIIIIIIAFKDAVRDFLQSPHSASNSLQQVRSSGLGPIVCKSCASNSLQQVRSSDPGPIVCKSRATHQRLSCASVMLRATWYTKGQLSCWVDIVEIAFFFFSFILLAEPLNQWRMILLSNHVVLDTKALSILTKSSVRQRICFC